MHRKIIRIIICYIFSSIPLLINFLTTRDKIKSKKQKEEEDTESEELNQNQMVNEELQKQEKRVMIRHILLIIFLLFVSVVFCHFNVICNIDKKTIGLSYKNSIFFY